MVLATNLGFPRMGGQRELKKAIESYWKGTLSEDGLLEAAAELRVRHWELQKAAGLTHIPANDFSLYDHMLDMSCLLGCVPARYEWDGGLVGPETYFAMARGTDKAPAMDMTKWFDTNYHYIVPEFEAGQTFQLSSRKIFDDFAQAKQVGILTRPVLVGPLTYLSLGRVMGDSDVLDLLPRILPVYEEILQTLHKQGAPWVQIDEPLLVLDLDERRKQAFKETYETLSRAAPDLKILLATYFGALGGNTELAAGLPVAALHIDLVRAPEQLDAVLAALPSAKPGAAGKMLSLGVIDGRNIWKTDMNNAFSLVEKAFQKLGRGGLMVGPSCSLLHVPLSLEFETALDPVLRNWMAFATEKLGEVTLLAKGINEGQDAVASALKLSEAVMLERTTSKRIHNEAVKKRLAALTPGMLGRKSPFSVRQKAQRARYDLPAFPTTSIGSFPQTDDIRKARAACKKGDLSEADYETAMKKEIAHVVRFQESIGVDVLVHGEAERNDMVEYFGERMDGFAFTKNGWVQSYGSRCVKPPVIFGDVSRPKPMTVKWSTYAQGLTKKPMKGMLTGPITILQWSFVRDDQPREMTCRQIALAILDEVLDLEKAGVSIIQIDEPAIREGLPLRRPEWTAYLKWAVESFRLCSSGVNDTTQIHTHMCYSEFNDIIASIGAMDADVISIETSRSQMALLDAFVNYKYPNEIGPGVYDIHSPRIPSTEEMVTLLQKAAKVIDPSFLWVNPDCGLKTRDWKEVESALKNMVEAAKVMRKEVKSAAA